LTESHQTNVRTATDFVTFLFLSYFLCPMLTKSEADRHTDPFTPATKKSSPPVDVSGHREREREERGSIDEGTSWKEGKFRKEGRILGDC